MARWLEFLAQFAPFKIQYVKGAENIVPDALSRRSDYFFYSDMDVLNTTVVPSPIPIVPSYGATPDTEEYHDLFHVPMALPDLQSYTVILRLRAGLYLR
eukprot:jgi/Mesvir1/4905/Mv25262-RA.1